MLTGTKSINEDKKRLWQRKHTKAAQDIREMITAITLTVTSDSCSFQNAV